MSDSARLNFVRQQGFKDAGPSACESQFPALMFQPKVLGALVLIGLISKSGVLFVILSAVLWWNVLNPALNPFDALYNRLVAKPKGLALLTPAPAPRRFAQGMAASFMVSIGVFLLVGWHTAAIILEVFLVVALSALLFGKFCLGSYIYHLIRGDAAFARRTLPWTRAE